MKQKRGILYWLRVILAAASVIFLCYRCSEGWGIPVYADGPSSHPDSTHSVTLTPQQTVALFGTELNALVRLDANSNTPTAIQFEYAFPASQIGWLDEGGAFGSASNNALPSNVNNQMTPSDFRDLYSDSDYLVYVADASQWSNNRIYPFGVIQGSGDYDAYLNLVQQGTVQPAQIHVPFSISLSGITGYYQSVFYSSSYPVNYSNPSWWSYNCLTLLTDTLHTRYFSMSGDTLYGVVQQYLAPMPIYGHTGNRNTVDETRMGYFAGWCIDEYDDLGAHFDVNGYTIDALMLSSVAPYSGNYNLWLLVGCPTLYNYNPPVTTTEVSTRPRQTAVPATYPVATMDSGVTGPLVVINDNSVTQVNQLNMIIGQLNLIYAQLVANGEIAVDLGWSPDLQDGDSISIYGTDIKHQMETIINGHTTAALPNFNNEYVSSGFGFLMDQPWIAMLGGLGLALSVACWIIFEGRH